MTKKVLYKFFWDCGRMGEVESVFIATPDEVANVIGKDVYFGEILGKHSDVYGTLEESEFTIISDDQEKIEWLKGVAGSTISGYNPLDYIYIEEDYEDDYEDDYEEDDEDD